MTLRRRAVISGAALALLVLPVRPAAAPPKWACEKGELCVWSERDFGGCFADFTVPPDERDYKRLRWDNCPARSLNDDVSSYRNQTDSYVFFFTGTNFDGNIWCAYPGASQGALNEHFGPGSADNLFSSHKEGPDESGNTSQPDGTAPAGCGWRDFD
jgi:hypothetical protein